jgi:hypothetical protein
MKSARRIGAAAVVMGAVAWGGCGGGGGPTTPPPPQPGVLQVAGTYQIVQQAVTTTCNDSGTPIPVTGVVTHTPGAGTFVLADTGGTTFNGTVQANGDFTANAVFGPDARGNTFTQRLAGRFAATGFTGRLQVDVSPQTCAFTRDWTATKQGAPNVFP